VNSWPCARETFCSVSCMCTGTRIVGPRSATGSRDRLAGPPRRR
jgi:hypothetical protein